MDLLCYNFTVTYQPGKSNPADYASRHSVDVATVDEYDEIAETEHYVAYIARKAVPKAMTLKEVELATSQDRVLHQPPVACAVIPNIDKIFAMFGTPDVLKSDNGPPFNGQDFAKFANVLGFKHRKVTPLWPRANGEVERFVKTLK